MRFARFVVPGFVAAAFAMAACTKKETPPSPELEAPVVTPAPEATPVPVETPAVEPGQAVQFQTIFFEFDSYALTPSAQDTLRKLAQSLKAQNTVRIQVEGHADERGSNEYNMALGEKRAQSVKDFLLTEGVTAENLSTISYGEEKPVAFGHDEDAWAKNRRSEFVQIY